MTTVFNTWKNFLLELNLDDNIIVRVGYVDTHKYNELYIRIWKELDNDHKLIIGCWESSIAKLAPNDTYKNIMLNAIEKTKKLKSFV